MSTPEKVNQALQTQTAQHSLQELIEKSAKELGRALPEHMRPERLVRIALTCIRQNPELTKCTPESFLGALFVSAQMGIEPLAGRAYILPFNNSKRKPDGSWHTVKEAQLLIGYRGLSELFYRHEKAVQLAWGIVRENDMFEYEYGTNAKLRHQPALTNRGNVIGYYVIAELNGGAKPFMFMTAEDCIEHGKKHSKTYSKKEGKFSDSSPWVTNTDAMCLKTVLVQLAKLLPLSIELQRAINTDETSREYRSGVKDAMDLPTSSWEEAPAEATVVPATPSPEPHGEEFMPNSGVAYTCEECTMPITKAEYEYSRNKMGGQSLCRKCQKEKKGA